MMEMIKEIYYVAWGDLRFMRHNIKSILLMSLMSPLLYLFAFGYALGDGMEMNGVPYLAFVIPGIVALSSLSSAFSSTSTRMNVQRLYYKSFDEMLMCPLHPASIVIGKAMLGVIRSLMTCFILMFIGLAVLHIEGIQYLIISPTFVLCLLISSFSFALLGESAALLAKSHQSMGTFSTLVILPMTFLCGTFFEVSKLAPAIQAALSCLPLTHSSICIRATAIGESIPWFNFAVMAAFGIAFFSIDFYLVKNKKV
jgi:ABC-2 type transport system permease protein